LCTNPCKNPDFVYYNEKTKLCYSTYVLSNLGETKDCETFCGVDDISLLT
jgi:hypothetical protein